MLKGAGRWLCDFGGEGGWGAVPYIEFLLVEVSHAMMLKKTQEHYLPTDTPIFRKSFNLHIRNVHVCSNLMIYMTNLMSNKRCLDMDYSASFYQLMKVYFADLCCLYTFSHF